MSTTGTLEALPSARILRNFLSELMEEAGLPAVCARIRKAREAIIDPDTGRQLSQATAASRMRPRVTEKTWREYETRREPSLARLRQIAAALELPEDYFLPSENVQMATVRLEAETDRLRELGDELAELLETLRSQTVERPRGRSQRGQS